MDTSTPRPLGSRSPVTVTPLGFGAGPIGDRRVPTVESLDTVRAAWDGGVRFFDTAPFYGIGRSERRLGTALADCGDRAAYRVNTKVGRTLEPEPVRDEARRTLSPGGGVRTPRDSVSGHRVHFDYSYDALVAQHRDSLQRLGLPSVDSLTIHDVDYGHHEPDQVDTALAELSGRGGGGGRALEDLRAAGVIGAIGAGCNREMRNYGTWEGGRHEDLIEQLADTVDLDFLILAGPYTLLDTVALRRVLPLCAERGMRAIVASPFAGGWLVAPDTVTYMYGERTPDDVVARTARLQAVANAYDVPLAAVALQFPLAHPLVAAVIPGARSAGEAAEARRLLDVAVPGDLWVDLKRQGLLDEAAPTPG